MPHHSTAAATPAQAGRAAVLDQLARAAQAVQQQTTRIRARNELIRRARAAGVTCEAIARIAAVTPSYVSKLTNHPAADVIDLTGDDRADGADGGPS